MILFCRDRTQKFCEDESYNDNDALKRRRRAGDGTSAVQRDDRIHSDDRVDLNV